MQRGCASRQCRSRSSPSLGLDRTTRQSLTTSRKPGLVLDSLAPATEWIVANNFSADRLGDGPGPAPANLRQAQQRIQRQAAAPGQLVDAGRGASFCSGRDARPHRHRCGVRPGWRLHSAGHASPVGALELVHELGDGRGPAGLVTRAETGAGVAVDVLVERDEVQPGVSSAMTSSPPMATRRPFTGSGAKIPTSRWERSRAT